MFKCMQREDEKALSATTVHTYADKFDLTLIKIQFVLFTSKHLIQGDSK